MNLFFLQESLQHPGAKGCVPSNQRQLFLDQEIFDQQERHILHPVILCLNPLCDVVWHCSTQRAYKRDSGGFADENRDLPDVAKAKSCRQRCFHLLWSLKKINSGSISYGVDLAVLSLCNHTVNPHIRSKTCSQVLDYGTFGLWAALLAGGRIVLPSGFLKKFEV